MKSAEHIRKQERIKDSLSLSKSFFQPKLTVNQPNDVYEQEADAMADRVMRMAIPDHNENTFFKPVGDNIQRKCQHCEDEEKLHRKETSADKVEGSYQLDNYVGSLGSSGQALPQSSRQFFEPRFGQDFSNVRLHTDSVAAKSAQSINALAYTTGNNIVFNSGQYSPESDGGKRLMAHELTHVVQQKNQNLTEIGTIRRVPQEPTLGETKTPKTNLPMKSLKGMDIQKLFNMSADDRKKWYIEKLGAYESQLKESANNNVVPVQLLALVILNELADIDYKDILQSELGVTKGSLGIAQIQIDTVKNDNLFDDITEQEGKEAYKQMVTNAVRPGLSRYAARWMEDADKDKRMAINRRLQIPQYAIEAAAKEIRILLDRMMANRGADWQTRFGFVHAGIKAPLNAQGIYDDVKGTDQREKEMNLANLITGAYNSPKIIQTANSSEDVFPNANIHGDNSRDIAGELFDFKLFRP
ncbi:protein of unknown function [Mucilaginibacter sp. OK268]|uniref:eCIS core domain-containing protein n=1 Tax=Mucilaginibacter sp. OK268 TaxID=1881048 RepID=UPI0008836A65|nr:DUF4157 domain-containing protein [Mucilaginibacter sp. OK268]SDP92468.1 protein of unknown function [Mucilaginibacter sp. OK268]